MEVRAAPHDDYNRCVDDAHGRMVWTHRGMTTWYRNSKGRVVTNSPWRIVDYWKMTYALNPSDYVFRHKPMDGNADLSTKPASRSKQSAA